MKANPGGQIEVQNVLGRDALITFLWERLSQQSILLTAERRIGKTTILKEVLAEPLAGFVPIYQDLEGISNPAEFVEAVGLKLRDRLSPAHRIFYEGFARSTHPAHQKRGNRAPLIDNFRARKQEEEQRKIQSQQHSPMDKAFP